jgi:Holliday junction DNA helicase RuvB
VKDKTKTNNYEYAYEYHMHELEEVSRPQSLNDFLGQNDLKKMFKFLLKTSKKNDQPLPHFLLTGGPGLGKTTLSYILARERGVNFKTVMGASLKTPEDLAEILVRQKPNSILFIDEIHQMNIDVMESLYYAMEDFKLSLTFRGEPHIQCLWPWTLIAATTIMAKLPLPLRDRFGLHVTLKNYTNDELAEIALSFAKREEMNLSRDAALMIAFASRSTPRLVNRICNMVKNYVSGKMLEDKEINQKHILEVFSLFDINEEGFTDIDIKYLKALLFLYKGKPVGLRALAATIEESVEAIESVAEPFLVKNEFVIYTPRGRMITDKGKDKIISIVNEE